jgi:hypothetical protein
MLREKIINILFENAFISALQYYSDDTDAVADTVYECGKNSFEISYPDDGASCNGTMRTIRSRLYNRFTKRLVRRLIEKESEK